MSNELLRVPLVLSELLNTASTENKMTTLTALNEIVSKSKKEIEILHNSGGIKTLMKCMESNGKLVEACLKIFVTTSRKHVDKIEITAKLQKKIREELLKQNVFTFLGIKLTKHKNITKTNFVLYIALIVILVQGNCEAQNQMRMSGCLSRILNILSSILDDIENKASLTRNAELVLYAVTACIKDPRHPENQTEAGWITPKILNCLGKFLIPNDKIELKKCFWSLLKSILDENKVNQDILVNSSGMIVLFRNLQEILEGKKPEEKTVLLPKMTGLLVKLKSHEEFLYQSSGFCPVVILCNLLKTCNYLVIQHVIIFLESLAQAFPQVISIMRNSQIRRTMKRAQILLTNSSSIGTLCQNLCLRVDTTRSSDQDLSSAENKEIPASSSLSYNPQTDCALHGYKITNDVLTNSLFDSKKEKPGRDNVEMSLRRIKLSLGHVKFHRKELRKSEKVLREMIKQILVDHISRESSQKYSMVKVLTKKFFQVYQAFCSYFR